jgi:hypothetical protein
MSIEYGTTIENFIGRYNKLSRAVKSRFMGKNIAVHLRSLAHKMTFTELKSDGGFRDPSVD